ncbi:MAG: class I SAM-dependent methyltransferase [Myxococcales bacterium]|nr:class I SAM-dependent methyltransferase [Myxococcales bacterium]
MDLRERRAGGTREATRRHPWEERRAAFFGARLASLSLPREARWLDAGAGDGWLATTMRRRVLPEATLTCWDAHYDDADIEELSASGEATFVRDRPDGPFDLVTALDVLEHVEDDGPFLAELFARIRPGGTLLISVPAWPMLYGPHDGSLAHYRRYRPADARRLVEGAGFVPRRQGGLFHSLLPVRVAQRLVSRHDAEHHPDAPASDAPPLHWSAPEAATAVVLGALALDNALSAAASRLGLELPGLTWWAVCARP